MFLFKLFGPGYALKATIAQQDDIFDVIVGRSLKTGSVVSQCVVTNDNVKRTCDWADEQPCGVWYFGFSQLEDKLET